MTGHRNGGSAADAIDLSAAALFLDLDGTLTPLCSRPSEVPPEAPRTALIRRAVDRLGGRVAIVSGRTVADIDEILEGACVAVSGVHGLQRRSGLGLFTAAKAHASLGYVTAMLAALSRAQPGLILEDKQQSVALHCRGAPQAANAVLDFVTRLADAEGLTVQEGHQVVELRTPGPDKGAAVAAFLKEAPFQGGLPIYVGDDLTDEAAFRHVAALGGLAVLVGPRKPTAATAGIADPRAVHRWIGEALDTGRFQPGSLQWDRLIVVSNRVQPPIELGGASTGGLAMALSAALRKYSGLWFGWSGETTPAFTGEVSTVAAGGVTIATIDLEEQDRQEYYNGYANKTLWPLFHYRTDLAAYERSFDAGYERVNERFAGALAPLVAEDDFIWVHDYHLLPLARELRRRGVRNRIGFFLHIPWPSRRVLTTLPGHEQLVEALLHYDLVGFQTVDSREAFADYVTENLHGTVSPDGAVAALGRRCVIGNFPSGSMWRTSGRPRRRPSRPRAIDECAAA